MNNVEQRIQQTCDFIANNLDVSHSLDSLSEFACYSKFHFHRAFKAHTGLSLTRYILLLRLRRASFRIAFEKQLNLLEIGFEAGFDSAEAFTRAFQREVGELPSVFRQDPNWANWHQRLHMQPRPTTTRHNMNVAIKQIDTIPIAYLTHLGSPQTVLQTAGKFIEWRKESGLSPVKQSRTFGIPYSDPETTPADEFRWDVCGSVTSSIPDNRYGVKNGAIAAGRYAVLQHQGSHAGLNEKIWYLFDTWLPQNNEEPGNHPIVFEYLNFVFEVDEHDLLTDIYLPLK
ncbi:AraC family transcriptional regulator [Alteromonas flava]|uniref:AraC family transcriptional regulator n=1 Tax=Alteromonas flava TaxID=2048003 RepID=UPI000C291C26|nr:AraC family transcriptional regulator [Alteromonas flava]